MTLAYIDIRFGVLLIVIVVVPILVWMTRQKFKSFIGYPSRLIFLYAVSLCLYQFILFGPFVGEDRIVVTTASWKYLDGSSKSTVLLSFEYPEGYSDLRTSDLDVLNHVGEIDSNQVQLSLHTKFDFGRLRGILYDYAYVDGVLFRPE